MSDERDYSPDPVMDTTHTHNQLMTARIAGVASMSRGLLDNVAVRDYIAAGLRAQHAP